MGAGGRKRTGALVGLVVVIALAAPGCTLSPVPVAVVGRDAEGTAVVGAHDCSLGGGDGFDSISAVLVSETSDPIDWSIERSYGGGSRAVPTGPGTPPPPSPRTLADAALISIGSFDPPGWNTVLRPDGDLPGAGSWRITFSDSSPGERPLSFDLPVTGRANSFLVDIDGRITTDVTAEEAARLIGDACDEGTAFDGGTFAAILGGSAVGIVVLLVVASVVTARQYKRAGERGAARVEADRAAWEAAHAPPPPPPG